MRLLLRAAIIILIGTIKCGAILIDEMYDVDESDLETICIDGEIAPFQYQQLQDIFESERQLNPDVKFEEFYLNRYFPEYSRGRVMGFKRRNRSANGLSVSYKMRRTYYVKDNTALPSEFYRTTFRYSDNLMASVELKGNSSGPRRIYRRTISWRPHNLIDEISIGSFKANIGAGLNVGRRDYYDDDDPAEDVFRNSDFWEPPASDYNGLFSRFSVAGFHPAVMYTQNDYPKFHKDKTAAALEYSQGQYTYGLVASEEKVLIHNSGERFRSRNGGAYICSNTEPFSWQGEFSISPNSGPAFCAGMKINDERFTTKSAIWNYGQDYFNLSSSGYSDSDEKTFYMGDSWTPYSNRHKDKSGVLIANSFLLSNIYTITCDLAGCAKGYESQTSYQINVGGFMETVEGQEVRIIFGTGKEGYYNRPSQFALAQGYIRLKTTNNSWAKFEFKIRDRKMTDDGYNLKMAGLVMITLNYAPKYGIDFSAGAAAKRRVWIYTYRNYTELFVSENFRVYNSTYFTFKYVERKGYGRSTAYVNLNGEF